MILAGRNLVCLPEPITNVRLIKLLDISYNNLKTMNGIHQFGLLEELILDNNGLSQLFLPPLARLRSLTINNNNLQDLSQVVGNLEASVPQISYLSLLCNPLCPNELMSGDEDDYQVTITDY